MISLQLWYIFNLLHYSDKLICIFWVGGRGTEQKSPSRHHQVKPYYLGGCIRMHCGFTAWGKTTAAASGSVRGLPELRQMLENMSQGRYFLPTERRRKMSSFHNVCSKYVFGGIVLLKPLRQKSEERLGPAFSLKIYWLHLLFPIVLCKRISGIKNIIRC